MTTTTIKADPTAEADRPCPTWCTLEPGHPFKHMEDTGLRTHRRPIKVEHPGFPEFVALVVDEQAEPGQASTLGEPYITITCECECTGPEARLHAAAVLAAADAWDAATR